jgi:hypothetical protein
MAWFLLAFILIYSSMHALVAYRVQPLLPRARPVRLGFYAFLAMMILCPVMTHLADRTGHHALATILAWSGYTWMGFVFVAFCLGLAFTSLELLGSGLRSLLPEWQTWLSPGVKAGLLIGLSLVVLTYGAFEARTLQVVQIPLVSSKLESPITVAQISDLHLGLLAGQGRVRSIRTALEDIRPDILVCTGDLIDSNPEFLGRVGRELRELEAPLGKFAVSGNHETYAGLGRSRQFLRDSGFTVLDDEIWTGTGIVLAGRSYRREPDCSLEAEQLKRFRQEGYVILLKHDPKVCPESQGGFDLQLSGHTHKGQIFPFGLVVKLFYTHVSGRHQLPGGGVLYVNQGTGTWGPQVRVLAPPELTVFTIGAQAQP